MHFCEKCDNMYYIKMTEDDTGIQKLTYYCRNCGNENTNLVNQSLSVSRINIKQEKNVYKNYINEYTKLDPTIPHITNIDCPNVECPSRAKPTEGGSAEKSLENDVLYMRINDDDLTYVYLCAHCNTTWKSSNNN